MPDLPPPRPAMHLQLLPRIALTAAALACAAGVADAQAVDPALGTFENLQHSRSVSVSATVAITSGDTGETESAWQADFETKGGAGPATYDSAAGLSDFGISTADGVAGGGGRASAQGEVGAFRITYDGFADVFVGGYSSFGYASGSGGASSSFTAGWTVSQRTVVEFTIRSEADPVVGEFSVVWMRSGGPTLFDFNSTAGGLPNGGASWTTRLALDPGDYSLQSNLTAYAQFEADQGFAGRSLGRYSITVIPEPSAAAALTAALLTGLACGRRVLRPHADAGCPCQGLGKSACPVPSTGES